MWVSFCKLIGRPEWIDDPRFESNPKRVENREALLPLVAEVMARKTCAEWVEQMVAASIPCGPVNNMQRLFSDPQVLHRGMRAEVPHPTLGTLRLGGIPIKYAATPAAIRLPPPLLGQHTDEILADVLGYSAGQIKELRKEGAI